MGELLFAAALVLVHSLSIVVGWQFGGNGLAFALAVRVTRSLPRRRRVRA